MDSLKVLEINKVAKVDAETNQAREVKFVTSTIADELAYLEQQQALNNHIKQWIFISNTPINYD
jgi:hypothetical protein